MIIALFLLASSVAQASTPLHPVVQNFKDVAEFTVLETQKMSSGRDWLLALNHRLGELGVEIVSLFQKKHPECEAQLNQLLNELPKFRKMKIEEIMTRYHDGVGMLQAPDQCIYGRVYLVHPAINLLRIERGESDNDRAQMVADLNELLKYIPNLQKEIEL